MSTVFQQLQGAMAQALKIPPDKIAGDSRLGSIPEWDSLGHVNLMITLEQTFGVELQVEDFQKLVSVPAILAFLVERGVA